MKRKFPRWLIGVALLVFTIAAFIPVIPLLHKNNGQVAHAANKYDRPIVPHNVHPAKRHPHHSSKGVVRTHLPTLSHLSSNVHLSKANTQGKSAWASSNVNANSTTTLFFDNMESGAPGWATVGDNLSTSYYPNGHNFWNLPQNPQNYQVSASVNPALVSYPDTAGMLPAAHSGSYAWGYEDTKSSGYSTTYMGNSYDWPAEYGGQNGGISNGPNSGSLISPVIDLTSAPNATLTFATWWEIESVDPANFDMMYVDVTTDGGKTWQSLGVLNPTQNPPGGADPYPYTDNGLDTPASWQIASANLSHYTGSKIQVRFRFDSVDQYDNGFRGWLIDDVGVYSNTAGSPLLSTVTPNAGTVGDTVTIAGSGFGAQQSSSTVAFNGVTASIQSWSDTNIIATIPSGTTSGPLIVTVNGTQTGAVSFTVNANVTLSSSTSYPQATDALSGQGFAAGEQISMYINGVNGTLLTSATADNKGNLPATTITIPSVPTGNYLVLAVGQTSHITAGTTLSIIPTITSTATIVKPGQSVSLTALGFAQYETVAVSIDTVNTTNGYLSCDSTGSCSGSVVMPSSNIVQGTHLLIATGYTSGSIAETALAFTPAFTLVPLSGGPGTTVTLTGAAFAAGETVQMYWGTQTGTLEGTGTTDSQGNLSSSFSTPTAVKAGKYTITVVRTKQNPVTVTTSFQVLPPKMVATAGLKVGQAVTATLSGFQANEAVVISWNANGGQQLITVGSDTTGASYTSFTPPSAPRGAYTLTATGSSSGLQASSTIAIGPGILITPSSANPGGTITVTGGGFSASESILVYFQTKTNGITTATADTSGAFSTLLTVPIKYNPATTYYVYAVGTNKDNLRVYFSYVLPGFTNYNSSIYGQQTTFYGQGFVSKEIVSLYWAYQQTGQVKVATVTAASDGTFQATFTVPSDPNLGYITVAAIGGTSKLKTTINVYEYAGLTISPGSGPAGTKVHVTGGGFTSGESVAVTFNNTSIATVTASTTGEWTTTFVVPTTTTLGSYAIQAVGGTSGVSAYTYFTVIPTITITPTTGLSGSTVTVTGKHFSTSNTVYLYWYDPSTGNYSYLGSFSTSATGTFKTTITVPTGLVSGNTYYVQAYDGPTNGLAQAAFVAQ